jgi:hypothetical protein
MRLPQSSPSVTSRTGCGLSEPLSNSACSSRVLAPHFTKVITATFWTEGVRSSLVLQRCHPPVGLRLKVRLLLSPDCQCKVMLLKTHPRSQNYLILGCLLVVRRLAALTCKYQQAFRLILTSVMFGPFPSADWVSTIGPRFGRVGLGGGSAGRILEGRYLQRCLGGRWYHDLSPSR